MCALDHHPLLPIYSTSSAGAFTGGFSAGYFNTVGSAAGFEPTTFRSSRSDRAGGQGGGGGAGGDSGAAGGRPKRPQQTIDDFLDEDELEERKRTHLHVKVVGGSMIRVLSF